MKLKTINLFFFSLILILSLFSCDLFDYHPLHNRAYMMGGKELNAKNENEIWFSHHYGLDTISFVFMGDTHNDYTITKQFVKHINERKEGIDFVIHAGDLTDFGHRKEYQKFYDIFSKLEIPYIVLAGNHDLLNYGRFNYQEMFGDTNFSLFVGNLNFIFLNTNMLCGNEYDEFIDYAWTTNEWAHTYRNIFVMHSPPYSEQFNDTTTIDRFGDVLTNFSGPVLFCLYGHVHKYSRDDFYNTGIMFYGCDNIAKRTYLLFTVTANEYKYELVEF